MKQILFVLLCSVGSVLYSQETVNLPGESSKTYKISGTFMGQMIRSTGGVEKKRERYFLALENKVITIWKHVALIEDRSTELLTKTEMPVADIDWDYFERLYPEGPVAKKVSGVNYFVFSINTVRGKRFKQEKYTRSEPDEVTVGNLDIHINKEEEAKTFFNRVKAAKS